MIWRDSLALSAGIALVVAVASGPAAAEISDDVVKIGVLNDRSGLYADLAGEGSVVAAQMAVTSHVRRSLRRWSAPR